MFIGEETSNKPRHSKPTPAITCHQVSSALCHRAPRAYSNLLWHSKPTPLHAQLHATKLGSALCHRAPPVYLAIGTVLHCTVLYCTVLYCTVLYCTVLYVLYVLYCTVLYCTVLYCTVLYVLYVLYCTVLYCTVLYCTLLPTTFKFCGSFARLLRVKPGRAVTAK
jgi:hypothetical protein